MRRDRNLDHNAQYTGVVGEKSRQLESEISVITVGILV